MFLMMEILRQIRSNDCKVLGSDEGIKLALSDGKVIGDILGNLYVITLGFDVGT